MDVELARLLALLAIIGALATMERQVRQEQAAASSAQKLLNAEPKIVPGDVEIELGSSLIVTAEFTGTVPQRVTLDRADQVVQANHAVEKAAANAAGSGSAADSGSAKSSQTSSGTSSEKAADKRVTKGIDASTVTSTLPMRRSLEDPVFAAYLTDVRVPLTYTIEYDGNRTKAYNVKVFEYPALVRSDADLVFPAYTQLENKTIVDTRRVSAVIGTDLTWICHVNKQLKKAVLVDEDNAELELVPDQDNPQLLKASLKVTQSRVWQVRLTDESGRANKLEVKLSLKALPNAAPKLKLATGDVRVSPLEEFLVGAKASDDFGLERIGLTYQLAGEDAIDVDLTAQKSAKATDTTSSEKPADAKPADAKSARCQGLIAFAEDR